MFHKHDPVLIAKTHEPFRPATEDSAAWQGSTSFLFECQTCRKQWVKELPGSDEDALDSILAWVDQYGHKYTDRDGKLYLTIRVRDEEKPAVLAQKPSIPVK